MITPPPHGERRRYEWKPDPCRCPRCTAANTLYQRSYRYRTTPNEPPLWATP